MDTYILDVDASIAANYLNATKTINPLFTAEPQLNFQAYVTHLWTHDSDLAEYQQGLKNFLCGKNGKTKQTVSTLSN